jgi:uroporphyrin-3 C-methyltransferase
MTDSNDAKIDEIAAGAAAKATKSKPPKRKSHPVSKLAIMNFILLAGVCSYAYLIWTESLSEREQWMADSELRAATDDSLTREVETLQQTVRSLESQLANLSHTESVTRQHDQRLTQLEEDVLGVTDQDRRLWRLEEVAFLLRVARERLLLSGDVVSAEALLESADQQLSDFGGFDLRDVRAGIAADLLAVRATETVDRVGIYGRVSALSAQIDAINWRRSNNSATEVVDTLEAPSMWSKLTDLITIHDLSRSARPSILPENDYFLERTLHLLFEESLLALMENDEALWEASLKRAAAWVNDYADDSDHSQALIHEIETLSRLSIGLKTTDIGAGERALSDYQQSMALEGQE